jgi:hypothetical protein
MCQRIEVPKQRNKENAIANSVNIQGTRLTQVRQRYCEQCQLLEVPNQRKKE